MSADPEPPDAPRPVNTITRASPWYWIGPGIAFLAFGVWLLLDPTFLAKAPPMGDNSWVLEIPYSLLSVIGRTPTVIFMIVVSLPLLGWGARLWLRKRAAA